MKVLVATAVLCVLIGFIQAEIGFDLSGSFNPGFTIGHSRRHRLRVDDVQGEGQTSWPSPDTVNEFSVPESFSDAVTELPEGTEEPASEAAHSRARHHRFHKH